MNSITPRMVILMVGRTLPPIREIYGDFDSWFQERSGVRADYQVQLLVDGDPMPVPADSDGWIITGSSNSVNDEIPWLPEVKDGIARAVEDGHPVLGVCFGHQLLAVSNGGRVKPNPVGWELGSATVNLTKAGAASPLFRGMDRRFSVYQTHQDVVTDLPPEAEILAANSMGLQAFQLNGLAFGVQFHPEFTKDITRMYVRLRSGRDDARSSLDARGESSCQVLTNFIQQLTL
ncbi:MAG: gamma-glutamyl-gamma-aminobutyrate hydrolase family protein [Fidelibacterota bacterium]|nr:MAG: gamma-glutamyl-gamma-aminobutyrate hydrolase family protein [Candidatus Neomarinimicrobiota bacterium]